MRADEQEPATRRRRLDESARQDEVLVHQGAFTESRRLCVEDEQTSSGDLIRIPI